MNDATPSSSTSTTAVEERPRTTEGTPPGAEAGSAESRPGVRDRIRSTPIAAKVAVGSAALVVALLAAGLGGFAIGRAGGDGDPSPVGFDRQGPGSQPGGGTGPFGQGGPGGQGLPDGQGAPDAGTLPDAGTDADTQTSWYVVSQADGLAA